MSWLATLLPQRRINLLHLSEIQRLPDMDQIECGSWQERLRILFYLAFKFVSHSLGVYTTTFLGYTHITFCGHLRLGWIPPGPTLKIRRSCLGCSTSSFLAFGIDIFYISQASFPTCNPLLGLSSPASFQIMNQLCDTFCFTCTCIQSLLNYPLCTWLFGTEFVEHFFCIARQILPISHSHAQSSSSYNTSWFSNAPSSIAFSRTWICYWLYIQQNGSNGGWSLTPREQRNIDP